MSAAGTSKLLTLDEDWNRAVAVAAHPDDLEYGAASAIARWTDQGKEITYLLLTRGEAGIDGMHRETPAHCVKQKRWPGRRRLAYRRSTSWTTRTG